MPFFQASSTAGCRGMLGDIHSTNPIPWTLPEKIRCFLIFLLQFMPRWYWKQRALQTEFLSSVKFYSFVKLTLPFARSPLFLSVPQKY